ncbi:MAG: FAD binding domain-containing protein [Candidatus Heimdallarchaeota archaeon]|nr:FAD binding domain-containing protein [Candidatus Heimdallarchaeota archaeon]
MKNLTEYLYPSNVNQALTLLSEQENSEFIAGGTAGIKANVTRLVDIMQLGLNKISKVDSTITVGSTSTLTEMYNSALIEEIGDGVLKKACQLCGDTPLRNVITLGGNVAHLYVWAGLPVVLLTLNAEIEILRANGSSYNVNAQEYFENNGVPKGELITKVHFPLKNDWKHFYEKFCLTTVDYTWLTMAFAVKVKNGKIADSRIAISRITKVKRITEVEKLLKGQLLAELDIEKVASTLQSSVTISADYRSSKEYRKQLLGTLFKRMLQQTLEENQ